MSIPVQPFAYTKGFPSLTLSGTTTSSQVRLDPNSPQVMVDSYGSSDVTYIRWGSGNQTAVTSDMRIPPGTVQVFSKGKADTLAGICGVSTSTLIITNGTGN